MSSFSDQIKGKWNQIQGKLKEKYGQLANDDLSYQEGKEEQLLGLLQEKLGKTKEEVKELIDKI